MNEMDEGKSTPGPWWLAFRVLDEPRVVFAELAVRPRVLVPFLVLFVLAPAFYAAAAPETVFRTQVEQNIAITENRAPDTMTPERREQMLADAASPGRRAMTAGIILVFGGLSAVIVTLLLKLIIGAMAPDGVTFKQEFAVLLHGWMPALFATLLVPVLALAGMEQLQLSLGFLFDSDAGFLYNFANGVTLFGVWSLILVAMGNQVLLKSESMTGSVTIIGGMWLLYKVAAAGLATAFSGIAG